MYWVWVRASYLIKVPFWNFTAALGVLGIYAWRGGRVGMGMQKGWVGNGNGMG